jgi:hypothetical protein
MRTPILHLSSAYVLLAVISLGLPGCGNDTTPGNDPAPSTTESQSAPAPSTMQLQHGAGSVEELINAAFEALAAGDTTRLASLMITREEFEEIIYPEFGAHYPTANDPRPETRTWLTDMHFLNANKGFRTTLARFGGKHLRMVDVTYDEGVKDFGSYTISEGTVVTAQLGDSTVQIRALGSIIHRDGQFKFMSYRDKE